MFSINEFKKEAVHDLQKNTIFCNLPQAIKDEIDGAKIQSRYKKGHAIYLQGTPLFGISCIQEGTVKQVKALENGDETIIMLSSQGDFLGIHCVLSPGITKATHTAIAMEDTTIYFYDKNFVLGLLKKHAQLGINIITKSQAYIERDEVRILCLSKKTVRERVAKTILDLGITYGTSAGENKLNIPLMLSRVELSSLAGTANETFIRTLSDFQKEGMIQLMTGNIMITDQRSLKFCTGAAI